MWAVVVLSVAACSAALAAPAPAPAPTPSPQKATSARPNQSAFVPSFDEVVVESSLTVRGKSGAGGAAQRQGRTKLLVVPTPGTPINGTSVTSVTADKA